MAPRTISQIAGEFGLARGAGADPFAQQEQAVLQNVQKSIDQLKSQQQEGEAARGFGRSSFAQAIQAQKEADILGQVGQQFAQARTAEQLQETALERDILRQQTQADVSSRLLGEQTEAERGLIGARAEAETGLIGTRGEQERQTLAQQLAGEADLIGARGEQQRLTLADQLAGEQQRIQLQAEEARQTQLEGIRQQAEAARETERLSLEQRGAQELGLIEARGAQQLALQQDTQEFQQALTERELEFRATESELAREETKRANAINLALQGNLTGEGVNQLISETFGPGTKLTTQDELDFQRLAKASGLSVEEFSQMREAIGQGQLADILNNPESYIETPDKIRRFEAGLAVVKINAQREAAGLEPVSLDRLDEFMRTGELTGGSSLVAPDAPVDIQVQNVKEQQIKFLEESLQEIRALGNQGSIDEQRRRVEQEKKLQAQIEELRKG